MTQRGQRRAGLGRVRAVAGRGRAEEHGTAGRVAVVLAKISAVTQVAGWIGGITAYIALTSSALSDPVWAWPLVWVSFWLLMAGLVAAVGMGVAQLVAKR